LNQFFCINQLFNIHQLFYIKLLYIYDIILLFKFNYRPYEAIILRKVGFGRKILLIPIVGVLYSFASSSFNKHNGDSFVIKDAHNNNATISSSSFIVGNFLKIETSTESLSSTPSNTSSSDLLFNSNLNKQLDVKDNDDYIEEFDTLLEEPVKWPFATKHDPFTIERISLLGFEQPFVEELLFRSFLFQRLYMRCGLFFAHVLTASLYSLLSSPEKEPHGAAKGLTYGETYTFKFVNSLFSQSLYYYTGFGLVLPVLFNSYINFKSLMLEFTARNDLIIEKLVAYKLCLLYMGYVQSIYSSSCDLNLNLIRSGNMKDKDKITRNHGRPVKEIEDLSEKVMVSFSSFKKSKLHGIEDRLLLFDIEDFEEAFRAALISCDDRKSADFDKRLQRYYLIYLLFIYYFIILLLLLLLLYIRIVRLLR
jgi:membrane protease YdiL (CAAX protease family)